MRSTALGMVKTIQTLEEAIADFDPDACVVATAARSLENIQNVSFKSLREKMENSDKNPILLYLGQVLA